MTASSNRLALGTVQFGLPYGIASHAGQVSREESARILAQARAMGLDTLDTAIAYGESEQRLGEIGVEGWQVVSKLPPIPDGCADVADYVHNSVANSLARLKLPRLRGMLLHRSHQLLGTQGEPLYRALLALKAEGKVEKIGISIYSPDELDALWPHFQFDLIQAPFSIFDRRLITSGWLKRLQQDGVELHARSVFLQGLLLRRQDDRPAYFGQWQALWDQWHGWLREQALTPLQACLGFVLGYSAVDRVVIGVKSLEQFKQIVASSEVPGVIPPDMLMSGDVNLINPSRWPSQ